MTDTSETYRHQCEVRYVLGLRASRGRGRAYDYLDGVEQKRGKLSRQKLEGDVRTQWERGNRGTTWCDDIPTD